MSERDKDKTGDPLSNLQARLREARSQAEKTGGPSARKEESGNMSQGVSAVFDLVATPLVCGGIGMGIDHFFGTSPVFFISLAFLGVLAGFWNLYRAEKAGEIGQDPIHSRRLHLRRKQAKRAPNSDE